MWLQQVGQDNATNIINQAKMQIIGDNIQNADEIYNIVYISLSRMA